VKKLRSQERKEIVFSQLLNFLSSGLKTCISYQLCLHFHKKKRKSTGMKTIKQMKRLVVIVIGFTMLAAGIAMIVLPGPAFIFIPAGLAILATEFLWAKKLLQKVKEKLRRDKDSKNKQSENEIH
jgi:uncharacterized protein (TIGR02611 family)